MSLLFVVQRHVQVFHPQTVTCSRASRVHSKTTCNCSQLPCLTFRKEGACHVGLCGQQYRFGHDVLKSGSSLLIVAVIIEQLQLHLRLTLGILREIIPVTLFPVVSGLTQRQRQPCHACEPVPSRGCPGCSMVCKLWSKRLGFQASPRLVSSSFAMLSILQAPSKPNTSGKTTKAFDG